MTYQVSEKTDGTYLLTVRLENIFPKYVSRQLIGKLQDDIQSKQKLDIYFDGKKTSCDIVSCFLECPGKNSFVDVWVEPTQEIEIDIVELYAFEITVKLDRSFITRDFKNILDNNKLEPKSGCLRLNYKKFGKKITKIHKLGAVINYENIDEFYFIFTTEPDLYNTKDFIPCPFCGKQPCIYWNQENNGAWKARAACYNPYCNVSVSTAKVQIIGVETRKDVFEAVKEYWNTRISKNNE